jgi:hypothetical protein
MLDFLRITLKEPTKEGKPVEVRPDFTVGRSRDLMIRGGAFYAIWDEERGLWSTDEYDVQRLVDQEIQTYCDKLIEQGTPATPKFLSSFGTNGWSQFRKFMKNVSDNSHQLDTTVTFANEVPTKKTDYVSRCLPYSLVLGAHDAWDELLGRLYTPEEKEKIEWSIGAIISGDAKKIEKFMVFYGQGGTGKSTVLKIIEKLFDGYVAMFEAKALVGTNNNFATEAFKDNPLVAIQHDGDLSKIEDNSKLNSVVGHDKMRINEKYKAGYEQKLNAFLYMGTNKAVKITDAKSGLIRRLIDVVPTGDTFEPDHYYALMNRIDFELGAIAHHCLDLYKRLGKSYYSTYRPERMMLETNVFHNFVDEHYDTFKEQDGVSLRQAYAMYKEWVTDTGVEFKLPQYKFRTALRDFFDEFHTRININGTVVHSYFKGFSAKQFKTPVVPETTPKTYKLVLEETVSLIDEMYSGMPAQYGKHNETPAKYWTDEERIIDGELKKPDPSAVCSTVLGDLDTSKLHFLKVPSHHIVIDFDLTAGGKKSLEANLEAASTWPATYAEISKSGKGVHLHYIYDGDPEELAREYSKGIEIKVFTGNSSLRRKLSFCNNVLIATISSGLPFREKKPVLETNTLKDEQHLRNMIAKGLRKDFEGLSSTKSNVDFIKKLTDDAYVAGFPYDITDLRKPVMVFATGSTNQALQCLKIVKSIKWASEVSAEETVAPKVDAGDAPIVIFDVECFPNFFGICWMYEDSDTVVRMVNPSPDEVAALFKFKLVGFNNRKYDNHMLYAASMGWNNQQLFELSTKLVSKEAQSAYLREAFSLSYADIYEFAATKMGLKKWQIKLGLPHVELDIPFTQPVPPELWDKVMDYCSNDVHSTREVFRHLKQDFVARQILADLSGLPVNATTQKHTSRIIFKGDRNPQQSFIYRDLSEEFPGYEYNYGKSTYCDEEVGEGGYVYAEPGFYEDVDVYDVASMHPTSIIQMEAFGTYTKNFKDLVDARLAIKHKDYASARKMLGGKLAPYLQSEEDAEKLSYAMKIVINIVYGLTAAKFDNDFRDIRNKDNYVAKRGALFMVDLKKFIQSLGFQVVHIKTDSIKIPGVTDALRPELKAAVMDFGKRYGYTFEHEATYKKFCLVNDAVYIAKYGWADKEKKIGTWDAVGAQFQHPWVFKNLFSGEAVKFNDLCETKSVLNPWVMYLDMNPDLATPTEPYAGLVHVGRTGSFVPVLDGGGDLVKVKDGQGKPYAVTGTKGYKWVEAEQLKAQVTIDMPFFDLEVLAGVVDMSFFDELVKDAKDTIGKYVSYEELVRA